MKKRIFYLDLLRIFAVLSVVMIHVAGPSVTAPVSKTDFIFGNILDSISRMGVPVFVMISGAMMLDENKNQKTSAFFKKYVLNLAVLLLIWSAIYTLTYNVIIKLINSERITLYSIVRSFVIGHYHMWFLYMIIGLYLITPILRLFVKRENKSHVLYLILVLTVLGFISDTLKPYDNSYLNLLAELLDSFKLPLGYLAYYLIGWYLYNFRLKKPLNITLFVLGALSLIYTALSTYFLTEKFGTAVTNYRDTSLNVLLIGVAFFLAIQALCKKTDGGIFARPVLSASKLTFGVYLIHELFVTLFLNIIPVSIFPLLRIFIVWLTVVICSFIAAFAISKIPFIKKVIRC